MEPKEQTITRKLEKIFIFKTSVGYAFKRSTKSIGHTVEYHRKITIYL